MRIYIIQISVHHQRLDPKRGFGSMTAIIIINIIFYGGLEGCVIPLCPRPGEKKTLKTQEKK